MPLNQPKDYSFVPNPVGGVRLISRSSRRSRLWAGGSFWRSFERGQSANLIQISCVEDLSDTQNPEGLLVVHHTVVKTDEQIFGVGFSVTPTLKVYDLKLLWDEEIRITLESGSLVAKKYGIRWQLSGGEQVRADYGVVQQNQLVSGEGVSFKLDSNAGTWPPGATLFLRPRVHRYHLVRSGTPDSSSLASTTGWDIGALRATLNASDTWVRMPARPQVELVTTTTTTGGSGGSGSGDSGGSGTGGSTTTTTQQIVHHLDGPHEDKTDSGEDDFFLTAFGPTNMTGGDGLPANPTGLNTGPDRTFVHLNYSEQDDGSQGLVNQVFEWVGDTAVQGSWQKYA